MSIQSPLGGKGIAPSNTSAAPRAFLLIFVAVVLGVIILWKGLDDDPQNASSNVSNSVDQTTQIVEEQPADLPPLDVSEISTTTVAVVETTPSTTSPPPLPTKPPSTVKVLVLNGSGVGGAAGAVTNLLKPHGYTTLSPANGNKDEKSWVYYKPEFSPDAKGVTDILGIMPDLLVSFPLDLSVPEGSKERVSTADVIVFLGSDKEIYG